jgi:hypothetical protein
MSAKAGPLIARREVLLGAGASAVALGAGVLGAGDATASAAMSATAATQSVFGDDDSKSFPIQTTLASAPLSEYTYRHAAMTDFTCTVPTAQRQFAGNGVSPLITISPMVASIEIPAGALVRDIEWYVQNNSGSAIPALARVWLAGFPGLLTILKDFNLPSRGSTDVRRFRTTVPSDHNGPFPPGTKLFLALEDMPINGTVVINGVRVGFNREGANTGLLRSVVRGYDSRSHSPLAADTPRTIALPAGAIFRGTTGIIATITVFDPSATGFVKVWDPDGIEPAGAAMRYQAHQTTATTIDVPVSSSRRLTLLSSARTDISVDITGLIA